MEQKKMFVPKTNKREMATFAVETKRNIVNNNKSLNNVQYWK